MSDHDVSQIPFDELLLPSLPAVAMRLMEKCEDPYADVKELARIVRDDQSLSVRYLKVANSAYTGWSRQISTLSEAFVVLGIKTVKTLALGFTLVSSLSDRFGDSIDMDRLWQRSLMGALAAQNLSKALGGQEPEEAFLASLLRDIGVLAMVSHFGSEYMQIYKMSDGNHRSLAPAEQLRYGFDHAQVGAALAVHWSLPDALVEPIGHHETCPEKLDASLRERTRVVHATARVPEVLMASRPEEEVREYYRCVRDCMQVPKDVANEVLHYTSSAFKEVAPLFDVKRTQLPDVSKMLSRANNALLQISLDHQRLSEELEKKNRELTELAAKDSLTGLHNRGTFDKALAEAFTVSHGSGEPLSVMLLDADHFKLVNDTHGHASGDEVLRRIGVTIAQLMPSSDSLACRYGGEEFALVLPRLCDEKAAILAERIRAAVERLEVTSGDGKPIEVTVSVGVVTMNNSCFGSVEALLQAADEATYAAKNAGRNTVRVTRPEVGRGKTADQVHRKAG